MARIKKYTIILLGEKYDLPINVSSKGRFSTIYPSSILKRHTSKYKNDFQNLSELYSEIHRLVDEINNQETIIEYLLVYRIQTRFNQKSSEPMASLSIIYTLYKKTSIGSDVKYNYIDFDTFGSSEDKSLPIPNHYVLGNTWSYHSPNINGESANPKKDNILPLTPENLLFFQEICLKLNDLNKMLKEYLEPSVIQNLINSGIKFPLLSDGRKELEE